MRLADILKFDINGKEFYAYDADSGSETLVNGQRNSTEGFFKAIVDSLGVAAPLLHNVLCVGPSCLEAREQSVNFTLGAVRFQCFKHALGRGRNASAHMYMIGRSAVTARQFHSRIREELGRSIHVVRRALNSLDRNFVETVRTA